jgi:hypothetical protein
VASGAILFYTSFTCSLWVQHQPTQQQAQPVQAPPPRIRTQTVPLPTPAAAIEQRENFLRLASLALDDPDPATRSEAAFELGEADDPVARQLLEQALYDSSQAVRRAAIDALSLNPHPDSIDALTRALAHPDPVVQDLADQSLTILRGGS